jgi:sialidase-1
MKAFFAKKSTKIAAGILLALVLGTTIFITLRYGQDYFNHENIKYTTDVFSQNENGYFCFRIPGLITLPDGSIIVFAEGRVKSVSDFGDIDLVMKKSRDGGRTWSELRVLWDAGDLSVSNPCPVFDFTTGMLFLHVITNRKLTYVMNSSDMGETWSQPVEINVGKQEWFFAGPAPGHGIQLQSGRLLIPGMYNTNNNAEDPNAWGSFFYYSDDHGQTWQRGHDFGLGTNECSITELSNGTIISLLRPNTRTDGQPYVKSSMSYDSGLTATQASPNLSYPTTICQISIVSYSHKTDPTIRDILISGHPLNPTARNSFGLRISMDKGVTWDRQIEIYRGPSAYSDLQPMENGTVYGVFERGKVMYQEKISFFVFDLNEILQSSA